MRCYACLLLLALIAISCQKQGFTLDTEIPSDNPSIVLVDTLSPYIEVEAVDSFITANTNVAFTGFHDDAYFGRIYSKPFFRLALPEPLPEPPVNAIFDSIQLVLRPNKAYYGDTTRPLLLRVYRLAEQIELGDRGNYYNTTQFARESNPVGQWSGLVYPYRDSVAITLSAAWGQELFNKVRTKSNEVTSLTNFLQYLPGLTIETDTTVANSIAGFNASPGQLALRLYYHVNDITPLRYTMDFTLQDNAAQFNHIRINRQQSKLSALGNGGKKLNAVQLGNVAYVQPLTGISSTIRFPSLTSLKEQAKFSSVISAWLTVRPLRASYVNYPLPAKLVLQPRDQYGSLGAALTDQSNNTQYGDLKVDPLFHENTYYQYDLTGYIRQQMSATTYETTSLVLQPPSENMQTQFDRLVFGVELKLYTLMYK